MGGVVLAGEASTETFNVFRYGLGGIVVGGELVPDFVTLILDEMDELVEEQYANMHLEPGVAEVL